jgi:hypothetical protein
MLDISPAEPIGQEYRFDWTSPMMLSQHDSDVLYVAGNRLFVSRDRGSSWTTSEDMSRQVDRDTIQIQGVYGSDITISRNDGTSSFGEAVTLDESPVDPAVLWVGFDDGNIQLSRDGGTTWAELSGNVPGVPDGTYVSRIVASASAPGTAYATFDAHRDGDFRPYVYRTTDFGVSWTPLHQTLPEMGSVNVIVEHPDNPNTLFLGTEHHVFASTDAGANWARIPNLPTTNYDDMVVHPREKDLVIGSHGQGVWILDDTRAIAEWADATAPVTVFSAPLGTIKLWKKDTSYRGQDKFAGTNPVDGVEITYRINDSAGSRATMRVVRDSDGMVVREVAVPGTAGTHRVNWDLRHGGPGVSDTWTRHESPVLARSIDTWGPWVSPGAYSVTIEAGGQEGSTTVAVRGDPEMPITQEQYEERERFMLDAIALIDEIEGVMDANGWSTGGGGGFGRAATGTDTPEAALRTARQMVQRVYRALNGGQVRPGSLYPPTDTQRAQVEQARRLLDDARE